MGAVYVAWDGELEREVALKTVAEPPFVDPRFVERLRRESRLAAALEHPAVVAVYDVGEADGIFFIAMRLVRGRDLRALLAERGPLELAELAALLGPVASALDAAHVLGLVHRDVKPANILVGDDGQTFLADFGLARETGGTNELSSTGRLVGTVDYVSPEQIRGVTVDGRADQYSLACVIFECLTGSRPFVRESELATLWAHVDEVAPLPSALRLVLPRAVDEAVAIGLAKDPRGRFSSCAELLERALRDDPELAPSRGPFVGLAAFDAADAPYFFGRERLVDDLLVRLRHEPLIALVGPSGSGKSSVLRAGLLPALVHGPSPAAVPVLIRPGERPLAELEHALRDPPAESSLVLGIDQFEELFTLCPDEQERRDFLDRLVQASGSRRIRIVLAIRDDHLGACAAYPDLVALLAGRTVLVGAMSRDELERTIVGPAARAGMAVEPELIETLLVEAGDQPGALPLLSTSLLESWQEREGAVLTLRAHERLGGLRGAIARRAEEVWATLDPPLQRAAERMLLRLAALGEGGAPIRRRVSLRELELERIPAARTAFEALSNGRLLVTRDDSVEVAHEALFREWPRLKSLLEQDADVRAIRLRVAEDAAAWDAAGRDADDVYRGARLAAALEWAQGRDGELTQVESDFLGGGRRVAARSQRRLRAVIGVLAALLALAVLVGAVALSQRQDARREARIALARELGAEAVNEPRIDRAMLLAREATDLDRSPQTAGTLLATLLRSPSALATLTLPLSTKPYRLEVSPDGRTLVVGDQQGALRFYDTRSRTEQGSPDTAANGYLAVAYSADGSRLLTAAGGDPSPGLQLLDGRTLRRLVLLRFDHRYLHPPIDTGAVSPLGLSHDGSVAFFAYDLTVDQAGREGPAFLDVWAVASGRRTTVPLGSNDLVGAGFIGRSNRLVTVTSTAITTWATDPLRRLRSVRPGAVLGGYASVSPDGRTIAALRVDPPAVVFIDSRSGRVLVGDGPDQGSGVLSVRFSPDDRTVATTGTNDKVVLWNAASGQELRALVGHGGVTNSAVFTADGKTLYSSSLDGAIFEWDLGGSRRFGRPLHLPPQPRLLPDAPQAPPLAVSPDSARFAVRSGRSNVAIYSLRTLGRERLLRTDLPDLLTAVAWSPRSPLLAAAGRRGGIQLWTSGADPRVVGRRSVPGAVQAVAFSPDGRDLAAVDVEHPRAGAAPAGRVVLWSTASGQSQSWSTRLDAPGTSIAFAPDGRRLAVGLANGHVLLVDATTGQIVAELVPLGQPNLSVAFATDGTLLTGSFSGVVQRWDARTGAPLGHAARVAPGPVASISFGPDPAFFATSSLTEGAVRLWTMPSLQQYGGTFPGDPFALTHAAITPDGTNLVVVFDDGNGYVWPLTPSVWERHACTVAGRNFSRGEWAQFVGGRAYAKTCPGFAAGI
jgi:WD40 repeat protein